MTSEPPEPPEPRSVFRVIIEGDADSRADLELIRPLLDKFRFRVTEKPIRGKAAGFFTHQLSLLYDIADDVEKLYPDFADREKKVPTIFNNLWLNETDRTEASDEGGSRLIFERIIRSGQDARRIALALQGRMAFWEQEKLKAKNISEKSIRNSRIELAERFLQTPAAKRHNGRPAKKFGPYSKHGPTIVIKERKGMPRIAMLDDAVFFLRIYGEDIFHEEVIDAILDNGGKK